jgi:exodeoxyribonuclease VII small subunit
MKDKQTYRELRKKLEDILHRLESEDLDIDEAIVLHAQGQKIVAEMEKYLKDVGKSIKSSTKNT